MSDRLTAADFPAGTPLHHFFAWNERRLFRDRRYRVARDPGRAPEPIAQAIRTAMGTVEEAAHAAVFASFEKTPVRPRRVLVIRLSAFGDFVQALGPFAAIRRHHPHDHLSLLTTEPFAAFARDLGYFDDVLIDERPRSVSLGAWLKLRRRLRAGHFDRVYDLQTSQRSSFYAWLLRPGLPEWSGIAWGCSHPHANLGRDRQHTLDKQAEQLLMAGLYPTPAPFLPPLHRPLPEILQGSRYALLIPGSSPVHPEKRWPAERFAEVAAALFSRDHVPVVVGTAAERPLAAAICGLCPAAVDLVGRTDITDLAVLSQRASLAIGNDTGACHLAAAAGCPVIVLFSGSTDPVLHAPRGRLVRIIRQPNLADLAPATVLAEAAQILGRTGEMAPAAECA